MTEFSLSAARARDAVSSIDMTKDERRTTAHVEELWVSLRSAERDRRHLLALIDDLAAALRGMVDTFGYLAHVVDRSDHEVGELGNARAALARLEGETHG